MCLVPVAGKHTLSGPHIASSNRQTRAPALVQEVTVFFSVFLHYSISGSSTRLCVKKISRYEKKHCVNASVRISVWLRPSL